MKKALLKTAACLLFAVSITSCSNESDIDLTNDASEIVPQRENRSSEWDGIIGQDLGGSNYEITADAEMLMADLQDIIDKENPNDSIILETLKIEERIALNDSSDKAYMLIASDTRKVSIGIMLSRNAMGSFKLDRNLGQPELNPKTVSCRGCASGCNLEYLYLDGKKVPICNENGCIADCTKTETELD